MVEFCGGDLPFGHRVFEVSNEGSVFTHRFLEAARRTRDRVRDLHPVLGLETPGGINLNEGVTESREFISSRACCRREVTRSLSHLVKVFHAVGSEFGGDRLNICQVIDGFVGVLSRAFNQAIDLFLPGDPRKLQGRSELIRRVRGCESFFGEVTKPNDCGNGAANGRSLHQPAFESRTDFATSIASNTGKLITNGLFHALK